MINYPIRRAFVPREGYTFYMLDYDQMEMRLMFDYAGEIEVIGHIKNGFDPHKATAYQMFKLTDETYNKNYHRRAAKTINFGLIYGMGIDKLAVSLGVDRDEAYNLKEQYFRNLPNTAAFIKKVIKETQRSGHIYNWMGREYLFNRDNAYKAVNYLIQGGCAEVVKLAMVKIDELLSNYKSRMILQVHDELIFEIKHGEEDVVQEIVEIMENIYPARYLKLTVGIDKSNKSWHDKGE